MDHSDQSSFLLRHNTGTLPSLRPRSSKIYPPLYQKNRLCPLCPVFFVISFILLKFFIVLNKRKNWETGQKCENPLIFLGFLLPTFVLKTGQKLGRNWAEALFQCFWPFIFQQKLGRNWAAPTFWNIKLGRKLAVSQSEIRSQ